MPNDTVRLILHRFAAPKGPAVKIDLRLQHPEYYNPPARPVLATFAGIPYVAVDGRGAPGGAEHTAAMEAIYPVAYAAKFAAKAQGRDFTVAKQEGLWWFDEHLPAAEVPRETWNWTLLIRLPDFVDEAAVAAAKATASAKKPGNTVISQVHYKELEEGLSVQMMHHGPFTTEPETVRLMKHFMEDHGLEYNGMHHEIYITDFRRLPPEKWRTVLRYPVRPRK